MDHLLFRIGSVFLEIAPHDMDITGQGLQVVQGLLGAKVASTEDVLDPARHQELLELGWQGGGPVRDVQVSKHQHQHLSLQDHTGLT